jgi:hypothetical protein
MGLDWCVQSKTKPGLDELMVPGLREQLEEAQQEKKDLWLAWLTAGGHEKPVRYPNPLKDAFDKLPEVQALTAKVEGIQEALGDCLISPMETLGAPRVGYDEGATAFAREQYRKMQDAERGRRSIEGITEDEFVVQQHGKYVPDLIKSDGLGAVTGMMAGATSFRGKVLRYCDSMLDSALIGQAYKDHEPEALAIYGQVLLDAAENFEDARQEEIEQFIEDKAEKLQEEWELNQTGEYDDLEGWPDAPDFEEQARDSLLQDKSAPVLDETEKDQIGMVRDAGKWCIFWGSRGHGMHAWY